MDPLYNLLLFVVDGLALLALSRPGGRRGPVAGLVLTPAAGGMLGLLLASDPFHVLRLFAFTLFLHLPLVLIGAGWVAHRRRSPWRWASVLGAGALVAVAVQAFVIEPRALEVRTVELSNSRVQRPLRIAVLADLQTDRVGDHERAALRAVKDADPDLVVMPGDYIQVRDPHRRQQVVENLRGLFREVGLAPRLGSYATGGNVDGPGWERLFDGLPVTAWPQSSSVDLGELRLSGLDLATSFNPRLRVPRGETFHLVFGHGPDFALGDVQADLLIAGHTHGGQVRLPWIGPLITLSGVPRAWAAGVTELDGGRTLVVSRGIGMERGNAPRLRFLCRPEVVIVDVLPQASADSHDADSPPLADASPRRDSLVARRSGRPDPR